MVKHRKVSKYYETDWGYLDYISKNELYKAYVAHDAAYSYSKDLAKRTIRFWNTELIKLL